MISAGDNFGSAPTNKCTWSGVPSTAKISKPVLCSDFCQQLFQPCLNKPDQYLFPIVWYPNQIVVDDTRVVRAEVGFVWHGPILAKEGGFLDPLKRSGFRRKEL